MKERVRFEDLLPAVRSLVAYDLVKRIGMKKNEAARILNLTPSAVSQYIEGKRGGSWVKKIKSSEESMLIIRELADRISDRHSRTDERGFLTELLDASYQVLSTITGGREVVRQVVKQRRDRMDIDEARKRRLMEILRNRLQSEQLAAQRSMILAISSKSDVARSLFRQIATDSLRHADIATTLLSYLQGEAKSVDVPTPKDIERIMRDEEAADDPAIFELKSVKDPAITLLIESIEADEEKHLRLLKGMLELSKRRGS